MLVFLCVCMSSQIDYRTLTVPYLQFWCSKIAIPLEHAQNAGWYAQWSPNTVFVGATWSDDHTTHTQCIHVPPTFKIFVASIYLFQKDKYMNDIKK